MTAQKKTGSQEFLYLSLGKIIVEEQVQATDSGGATQGVLKTEVKKPSLA